MIIFVKRKKIETSVLVTSFVVRDLREIPVLTCRQTLEVFRLNYLKTYEKCSTHVHCL